jgi:hypothetical protein
MQIPDMNLKDAGYIPTLATVVCRRRDSEHADRNAHFAKKEIPKK